MKEESYNLWPRDWDEKKIETYALKNETECFIDPESYELVNYHVVPHVKNLNPIQESLPNFNFPPLEIYVSSEINHENDEPPRFDFGL